MKPFLSIVLLLIVISNQVFFAQTKVFKEGTKWGIKENETVLIAPLYDSIFNFDKEGKVCLACYKLRTVSNNKIMKTVNVTFNCRYLNKQNKKLVIQNKRGDTCSVFNLSKHAVELYNDNPHHFVASAKGKRFLIDKELNQLTFKGYYDISTSVDPNFYITKQMDENEVIHAGVIDTKENEVVPYLYTSIKINPVDSLIMGCTAGLTNASEDDIYLYSGKKRDSYHRHVELATKHYVIQKILEPKEHFVIYNCITKEEKNLQASEVHFFEQDQLLIKWKGDWYVYDLLTDQKTEKQY
jgi:hypothetical protein